MTLQELITWCKSNNVSLDTPIAIRDKDDFLLTKDNIDAHSAPYFGNCREGEAYLRAHAPRDADGEVDYENLPRFLILGTGQ